MNNLENIIRPELSISSKLTIKFNFMTVVLNSFEIYYVLSNSSALLVLRKVDRVFYFLSSLSGCRHRWFQVCRQTGNLADSGNVFVGLHHLGWKRHLQYKKMKMNYVLLQCITEIITWFKLVTLYHTTVFKIWRMKT